MQLAYIIAHKSAKIVEKVPRGKITKEKSAYCHQPNHFYIAYKSNFFLYV